MSPKSTFFFKNGVIFLRKNIDRLTTLTNKPLFGLKSKSLVNVKYSPRLIHNVKRHETIDFFNSINKFQIRKSNSVILE